MFKTSFTWDLYLNALTETATMVLGSFLFGGLLGFILGILLVISSKNGIHPLKSVSNILNSVINTMRSLPFIILMIALIPLTQLIVGSAIGVWGAIIPLSLYIAPYISRLVETSLLEVNRGIIEAAKSMGAKKWQIVWYFMLPEAKSSLILNYTTAVIGLIDATTMAGAIGAGGIGDMAITYGFRRFDTVILLVTVITLIIIVQVIQNGGLLLARKYNK